MSEIIALACAVVCAIACLPTIVQETVKIGRVLRNWWIRHRIHKPPTRVGERSLMNFSTDPSPPRKPEQ
jgi:hypothetical protein